MSLANMLDVCLEDIQSGAATIEECLARYPEHAKDLAPLLATALLFDEAPPPVPPPAFKADLRRRLMDAPIPSASAAMSPVEMPQPAATPPLFQSSVGLANILDACLEDIQSGEATIEECLARYPEHAKDLAPLLDMALLVEQAAPPPPSPAFKAHLRRRLMAAPIPQSLRASVPIRRPAATLVPVAALAWWKKVKVTLLTEPWLEQLGRSLHALLTGLAPRAAAGAALVLFMAFWLSTSTFAAESLPGEPLYPVKRAGEQVRLVLIMDPFSRAQYHARLAEVRVKEAHELAARGQTDRAQTLLEEAKREEAQAVALGLQVTIVEKPDVSATETPPTLEPPTRVPPTSTTEPSATLTAPRPTASNTALPPATATRPLPIVAPTQPVQQAPADPPTATLVPPTVTAIPPTSTLAPPTATLVPPTATEVPSNPTSEPAYPAPPRPTSAYPEPPRPTSLPPTDTPIPRPEQPTARPFATRTNTPGVVISDPNATATHTPPPSATPTAQERPQRTPAPLPTRTPTDAPRATITSAPATATSASPSATPRPPSATPAPATSTSAPPSATSQPPAPPSPTSRPLAAPTNTSPPPAATATSKPSSQKSSFTTS